jgi:hypothetical protein
MDIGVAKAVSEATAHHRLTSIGIFAGTPAYRAPEQAAADPNVHHCGDNTPCASTPRRRSSTLTTACAIAWRY